MFSLNVLLIIGVLLRLSFCYPKDDGNVTNQISSLYFDVKEFQNSLDQNEISGENLLKIMKDLSSTLVLMLSEYESSKSFENAFTSKFREFQSEIDDIRSEVNETKCSLSTRIIDIENEVSKLKPNSSSNTILGLNRRGGQKFSRKNLRLTPTLSYAEARNYCLHLRGTPFVPSSNEELAYIIGQTTANDVYGWLPLTDILYEGIAEWDDGTLYDLGPLRLNFTDSENTDAKDCVDINKHGKADWYGCSNTRKMVCFVNW